MRYLEHPPLAAAGTTRSVAWTAAAVAAIVVRVPGGLAEFQTGVAGLRLSTHRRAPPSALPLHLSNPDWQVLYSASSMPGPVVANGSRMADVPVWYGIWPMPATAPRPVWQSPPNTPQPRPDGAVCARGLLLVYAHGFPGRVSAAPRRGSGAVNRLAFGSYSRAPSW